MLNVISAGENHRLQLNPPLPYLPPIDYDDLAGIESIDSDPWRGSVSSPRYSTSAGGLRPRWIHTHHYHNNHIGDL